MLVLNGYFDGNMVRTFEPIVAQKNQKVTLTVLDDFVEEKDVENRLAIAEELFGVIPLEMTLEEAKEMRSCEI